MKNILTFVAIVLLCAGCSYKNDATTVSVAKKEGLINRNGEIEVKPIYKDMSYLKDFDSNEYEHPHYINLHWLHFGDDEFAVVRNVDDKYGIIGRDGKLKLKAIFDSIGEFFNGYAKIEVDKKFGLINEKFEIVVKPIYDDVRNVIDGSVIVKNYDKNKRTKYGCLNLDNKLVAPLDYDMIYLSNEKRMRIVKDGKWGFMDTKCNVVVDPIYTFADDYSKGIARVKKSELWTYLNLDGKELTRKTFDSADNF
ncbi:MAG: WG repeat-containing protein [Halarcobacter sp.]